MREQWKDVVGFEGLYMVSNYGQVKSVGRTTHNTSGKVQTIKETILNPYIEKQTWYPRVSLWKDGRHKKIYVHSLVATAFIPNPKNKPQVNHKDSNRSNNRVSNLEWVTGAENLLHARNVGRMVQPPHKIGSDHHNAKLTPAIVRDIRARAIKGYPYTEIARLYKVTPPTVRKIIIGITWQHVK